MTPERELAKNIFKLFLREPYDGYFNAKPDEQLIKEIESLLSEAMEKSSIVTSDEGTSYCRFCEQRAISNEQARLDERERCAKIAEKSGWQKYQLIIGREIATQIRKIP